MAISNAVQPGSAFVRNDAARGKHGAQHGN
jgi:hypothetical protein